MHSSIDDAISSTGTPPIWYDEHAIPRYCAFVPERCAGSDFSEVALAEISCQECQRRFLVAFSDVNFPAEKIAEAIRNKTLHYGDPPQHGGDVFGAPACSAGDTMNSEPRRVLEYWRRHGRCSVDIGEVINLADNDWVRDPSLEIDIEPEWVAGRQ